MTTLVETLKSKLKVEVVTFQYKKKDGSIRTAKGTTNLKHVCASYVARGGESPKRYGYTSYWDVDMNGWRCFDENNLVAIL